MQNEFSGYIQTPNMATASTQDLNCTWFIKVRTTKSMIIKLHELQEADRYHQLYVINYNSVLYISALYQQIYHNIYCSLQIQDHSTTTDIDTANITHAQTYESDIKISFQSRGNGSTQGLKIEYLIGMCIVMAQFFCKILSFDIYWHHLSVSIIN